MIIVNSPPTELYPDTSWKGRKPHEKSASKKINSETSPFYLQFVSTKEILNIFVGGRCCHPFNSVQRKTIVNKVRRRRQGHGWGQYRILQTSGMTRGQLIFTADTISQMMSFCRGVWVTNIYNLFNYYLFLWLLSANSYSVQ